MANVKVTTVAVVLLFFHSAFQFGNAQRYKDDYGDEIDLSRWQPSRTSRTGSEDKASSNFQIKNSSPEVGTRARAQSRYVVAGNPTAEADYGSFETARQRSEQEAPARAIGASTSFRARQRTRQQVPETRRPDTERRLDEVAEDQSVGVGGRGEPRGFNPPAAIQRRKPNRHQNIGRTEGRQSEGTTQSIPEPITARSRPSSDETTEVKQQSFNRGRTAGYKARPGRQRAEDARTAESTTAATQPKFSRGRVRAKIYENPRKSESTDDISESDNYPAGFLEKIRGAEQKATSSAPGRSRLRQREAKPYQEIEGRNNANRFRDKYTRQQSTSERLRTVPPTEPTKVAETKGREAPLRTAALRPEIRVRNRTSFTTQRPVTADIDRPTTYRGGSYRYRVTTEKEETAAPTPSIIPRKKFIRRLKTSPKSEPATSLGDDKPESLESAEYSFYVHPGDDKSSSVEKPGGGKAFSKAADLKYSASQEEHRVHLGNNKEKVASRGKNSSTKTVSISTRNSIASSAATATVSAPITTPSTTITTKTTSRTTTIRIVPSTRHQFSSRFNRSNKTSSTSVDRRTTPKAKVPAVVTSAPLNLTALFDEVPDSTLSIVNSLNNSLATTPSTASAINKANSSNRPVFASVSIRPSTNPVKSSTELSSTTINSIKRKRQSVRSNNHNKRATTASPLSFLNDRPILRNLAALFINNGATTTRRSPASKKRQQKATAKRATTTSTTTTTTTTTTPATTTTTTTAADTTVAATTAADETSANKDTTTSTTITTPSAKTTTETTEITTTTVNTEAPTTMPSNAPTVRESSDMEEFVNETMVLVQNKTGLPIKVGQTPREALSAITSEITPREETTTEARTAEGNVTETSKGDITKNVTSQYIYFEYNSTTPIPGQFARQQSSRRYMETSTSTTTTTSTTADYYVFGVFPNNTVVRKRGWKTFDYERYNSPYVIFGIYPNNTIVKKFPNGTIINDEYMDSDNEIRDDPNSTTTTSARTLTTTASTSSTTSTTAKPETTTPRTEGGMTTDGMENLSTQTTDPEESDDSDNEIEKEERKDEEELNATTTAKSASTESDEGYSYQSGGNFLDEFYDEILTTTSRNIEGETTNQAMPSTQTTEAMEATTVDREKQGKSLSFGSDENERTTAKSVTTTETENRETTHGDSGIFGLLDSDLFSNSGRKEKPETTTESGRRETTHADSGIFDLLNENLFGTTRTTEKPATTTETSQASRTDSGIFGLLDLDLFGTSRTTEKPETTTATGLREAGHADSGIFGLLDSDLFGTSTKKPATTTESGQRETTHADSGIFDLLDANLFSTTRTTEKAAATTTVEPGNYAHSGIFDILDSNLPTTTDKSGATTTTSSATKERTTTESKDFDLQQIFPSSTASPASDVDVGFQVRDGAKSKTTTDETVTEDGEDFLFAFPEGLLFSTTSANERTSQETTTLPSIFNEILPVGVDYFAARANEKSQGSENDDTLQKSATTERDEDSGLINLAFRFLSSSDTTTSVPTHPTTTTTTPKYITVTKKSTKQNLKKMKTKQTSTSTLKPTTAKENVFIVTPVASGKDAFPYLLTSSKDRPATGSSVTKNVGNRNDGITLSSQHVQKVTKAPFNIPKNILNSLIGEIEEQSSTSVPADILRNVEKELQGNGISVSLARRIIEMAIERAMTTDAPQTSTPREETTVSTTTTTERIRTTTTTTTTTTTERPARTTEASIATTITTTRRPTTTRVITTTARPQPTTTNEITTNYNEFINTINANPPSVTFNFESKPNKVIENDSRAQQTQATTTVRPIENSVKRGKTSKSKTSTVSPLTENDKKLLEAILKQQNSDLSVKQLEHIIGNQIRLAEQVRKASKNVKKKRTRMTTTTTTTTPKTPPLIGFLFGLFSGNSSPSNIPVIKSLVTQTKSPADTESGSGSTTDIPGSTDSTSLLNSENDNKSTSRPARDDLVKAAIDVTKAISSFMGTIISSAAQSFQTFFKGFGRGR